MIPTEPFQRLPHHDPRPFWWKKHPRTEPEPEILPDEQPLPNPDENRKITLYFALAGEGIPVFHTV